MNKNQKSANVTERIRELCEKEKSEHPERFEGAKEQFTEEPFVCGGIAWTERRPIPEEEKEM